jgi:cytochrome oxidase Cu insertion factor (SCO1/SenC/PrrC family)
MRRINLNSVLIIILLIITGCGDSKQSTVDIITVDVTTTNYPKKEMNLQDFMDVEYIALETNDDFVNQGIVRDIGREVILVTNRTYIHDGNIFIYDRTGKALRKINRQGQGGEEYINILGMILDENRDEIYVNTHYGKKIQVYDLYGNFKRSLRYNTNTFYETIFNYDKDNLICFDEYNEKLAFVLISKQDGSITKEIKIPFKEKKLLQQSRKSNDTIYAMGPGPHRSMIPFNGNWLLSEYSSDTIYTFLPDYSLRPFLVRTPSIQSMNPEIMLLVRLFSDRYIFMETIKNVYDFKTNRGFHRGFLMYDRQEKAFFRYKVYNDDYSIEKEIYMNSLEPVNHEIETWQALEAHELVELYEKEKLKGKLKEIAATLKEDDNPVIMLIK